MPIRIITFVKSLGSHLNTKIGSIIPNAVRLQWKRLDRWHDLSAKVIRDVSHCLRPGNLIWIRLLLSTAMYVVSIDKWRLLEVLPQSPSGMGINISRREAGFRPNCSFKPLSKRYLFIYFIYLFNFFFELHGSSGQNLREGDLDFRWKTMPASGILFLILIASNPSNVYIIIPSRTISAGIGGISGEFGRAMARRSRAKLPMARPKEPRICRRSVPKWNG